MHTGVSNSWQESCWACVLRMRGSGGYRNIKNSADKQRRRICDRTDSHSLLCHHKPACQQMSVEYVKSKHASPFVLFSRKTYDQMTNINLWQPQTGLYWARNYNNAFLLTFPMIKSAMNFDIIGDKVAFIECQRVTFEFSCLSEIRKCKLMLEQLAQAIACIFFDGCHHVLLVPPFLISYTFCIAAYFLAFIYSISPMPDAEWMCCFVIMKGLHSL